MLNNIAQSEIGKYDLNEKRLEQFFNVPGIKFDTTNFAKNIALFQEKLGDNKPLKMKV